MPGRIWSEDQKKERSEQLKDYWKSPEGQARLSKIKEAGYDGTPFKEYWSVHKDKSLPDQRIDNTGYMRRLYEEISQTQTTDT